jgi:lipopolysaccharide export system protein LptA
MRMAAFVLVLTAAGAAPANPANPANFKLSNPDAPIEYAANHCDAAMKEGALICTGNVVIRQGEVRLRADVVRITAPDGKADTVFADGHVVIDSPSGTATGDAGVYRVVPRRITLTGNVVLTREHSVLRGPELNVDLISGQAKLSSGAGGTAGADAKPGRIQGLFTPKSADDGKN